MRWHVQLLRTSAVAVEEKLEAKFANVSQDKLHANVAQGPQISCKNLGIPRAVDTSVAFQPAIMMVAQALGCVKATRIAYAVIIPGGRVFFINLAPLQRLRISNIRLLPALISTA